VIPASFDYHRATSLDDAAEKLREWGDEAKLLAGGGSLIPFMRLRLSTPAALVDLTGLADLSYIRPEASRVRIGALARHREIHENETLRRLLPLLAELAGRIGDTQIRNRGTIGGAIAHADPAGEYGALCLMLDAEIVTTSRRIPAREFFLGRYTTPLADDEIVREVVFPVADGQFAYLKFCHRLFDWAIVGAAVQRYDDGWRVGLVNAGDTPVRATAVEQALAAGATIEAASELASQGLAPAAMLRASPEYKLHLARVLTRRALEQAQAQTELAVSTTHLLR
jgi:carbon-monoxide dehydrogenase medium subunit